MKNEKRKEGAQNEPNRTMKRKIRPSRLRTMKLGKKKKLAILELKIERVE